MYYTSLHYYCYRRTLFAIQNEIVRHCGFVVVFVIYLGPLFWFDKKTKSYAVFSKTMFPSSPGPSVRPSLSYIDDIRARPHCTYYNIFQRRDNRCSRKFGSPSIIHHDNTIIIHPSQSTYSRQFDSTSDCFVFRIMYYYYCLHAYCTVRLRFELVGSLNGAAHRRAVRCH